MELQPQPGPQRNKRRLIVRHKALLQADAIKLGLSIDEEEEEESETLPELESDDIADSSTMEEVD